MTGRWQHVAGTFRRPGGAALHRRRARGQGAGAGERKRNTLPLYVGADPDSVGKPESFFEGLVDEVRISKVARYAGETFQPERRFKPDGDTVLLLHLDEDVGPGRSTRRRRGARGSAREGPVRPGAAAGPESR